MLPFKHFIACKYNKNKIYGKTFKEKGIKVVAGARGVREK